MSFSAGSPVPILTRGLPTSLVPSLGMFSLLVCPFFRLLRSVTTKGEWEKWILYMLDGIQTTAVETRERITSIRKLLDQTLALGHTKLPARVYSKELIEILFRQPYTKVQNLVDSGIAERKTAAVYLRELEKAGILRGKKVGKEFLFLNGKLFQLLSK